MKILVVSGYFYPENTPRAFRTTELVKEFSRIGHEVTLYVPKREFDYTKFTNSYPIKIRYFNPIQKKRVFTGLSILDRIIFHYENWLIDYPSLKSMNLVKKAIHNETGYDFIITIAVPHYIHWAVGKIYAQGGVIAKKWIADCGDPFMLAGTVTHRPPLWFKPLEKRWCRLCDYISVPTDTSYQGYYPQYRNKIRIIPQGFNFDDIVLPKYTKNDIPSFAFAGSLIKGKRDPRRFLEWLATINIPFRLYVYGNNVDQFFGPFKQYLGDRLIINNSIPRRQLLVTLSKMDFLLNIDNGTNIQTPSKIIDYTLVRRPILTIDSYDIKQEYFMEFMQGDYTHKDAEIDISKYDIHKVARQFLDII